MKRLGSILAWISFVAVIDVVWLHVGAYGKANMGPTDLREFLWSLAVPWFFVVSMFWFGWEVVGLRRSPFRCIKKRLTSLVAPYFCWCVLGSLWSILSHGVHLNGWDYLRYVGLHPWKDPVYQPMWFIKDLFFVLLVEAIVLWGVCVLIPKDSIDEQVRISVKCSILKWIFPIYVIHSFYLGIVRRVTGKMNFDGAESLIIVVGTVGLSMASAWILRKYVPRMASILFGGR